MRQGPETRDRHGRSRLLTEDHSRRRLDADGDGLRQHLEDAYELAAPGEVYVVGTKQGDGYRQAAQGDGGWANANLRTTFEKLIRRAGLQTWPRLFQNLRASCETDLMQNHPIHVVTAWIGNTPKIALGHYLQTLDADFEKAVKGGAESGAESGAKGGAVTSRQGQSGNDQNAGNPGNPRLPAFGVIS